MRHITRIFSLSSRLFTFITQNKKSNIWWLVPSCITASEYTSLCDSRARFANIYRGEKYFEQKSQRKMRQLLGPVNPSRFTGV
jgi:hypothetical protein